jgi:raffinose/stachyose/melibiose transport system permease protein
LSNIAISLTRWSGIGTPEFVGLTNYVKAFADTTFWASFANNLQLILAMTIAPTILGILLSVLLFEYVRPRFGSGVTNALRAGLYLPQMLTLVVSAYAWRWILQPEWGALNWTLEQIGLESLTHNWLGDSATALPSIGGMMVWFQLGYPVVIFLAALQRINPEIFESAELDGAGFFHRITHIIIPQILIEINVVILTTMIHALKIFGPIYAMTRGGPGNATTVASYFSFRNFFEGSRVGYGSTIASLLSITIIAISAVFIVLQSRTEEQVVE